MLAGSRSVTFWIDKKNSLKMRSSYGISSPPSRCVTNFFSQGDESSVLSVSKVSLVGVSGFIKMFGIGKEVPEDDAGKVLLLRDEMEYGRFRSNVSRLLTINVLGKAVVETGDKIIFR